MSEFRSLLDRAHKAGAIGLTFRVTLEGYREDDMANRPWECHATIEPSLPNVAKGRTGEEALRESVAFLERIARPA